MKYFTFLFFFFSLALNLYYQKLHPINPDESDLLLPAIRILRGEVPYRDFFQFRTPGSFYFMALWFKIFGVSWTSIRLASALEGATILTLLYVLAKRIINSGYLALLAPVLSLPFCIVFWPVVSYHWFSTILGLWALVLVSDFVLKEKALNVFFAGVISGLCALFLQNKGFLLLAAFLVFIFLYQGYLIKKYSYALRLSSYLLSGFVLAILPPIIYLYIEGGITDFLYDTVLWTFSKYREFAAYPSYYFMGNMEIYKGFTGNPFPLNLIRTRDWILIGYLPPITILFSGLFGLRFIKDGKGEITHRKTITLIYIITGAFMFLSVLYRSDPVHITFIFPFIILLFCFLLLEWLYRSSGKGKIIPWALISLFLFYGLYGFYIRLKPLKNFNIPVQTKIGRLYGSDEKSVNDFRNFLDFLEDNARGKNIFVYNCFSYLYILTGRENPTRYNCIIPGHYTDEQLLEVVNVLKRENIEYIVYDGLDKRIMDDPVLMSYPSARLTLNNTLSEFVRENYYKVYEFNDLFVVLKKK